MRLVYPTNSVIPSRSANSIQVMTNCEAFAKLGHDVSLLVPDRDVEASDIADVYEFYDVDPCFDIRKYPRPNLSSAGTFAVNLRIGIEAARLEPDLVYGRSIVACYFASLLGAPTAYESHAPVAESRFGRVEDFFFRRLSRHSTFERLVVVSEALGEYYRQTYPHLDGAVVLARNGTKAVDADQPAPFQASSSRLQVGYVGHLYQGRGMDVVADLAARIPGADFHVIGGKPEDVTRWRSELSSFENVSFYGFVPPSELDPYRLAFDVQVAPYQWDLSTEAGHNTVRWMCPLKLIEYLAAGRAIVASDLPAIGEIIDDGETGLLCDPEDTEEWAAALRRLRDDPELRARLGDRARAEFEANYTLERRALTVLDGMTPAGSSSTADSHTTRSSHARQ